MDGSEDNLLGGIGHYRRRSYRVQEKWDTLVIFKDDKLVLMKFNNLVGNNSSDIYYETNTPEKTQHFNKNINPKDNNHIQKDEIYSSNVGAYGEFGKLFKTAHKLRNENWELAACKKKETLLQKYYRLKFQIEDLLLQETSAQKEDSNTFLDEVYRASIGIQLQNILSKISEFSINGFLELKGLTTFEICNLLNRTSGIEQLLNTSRHDLINVSPDLSMKTMLKPNLLKIDQSSKIFELEQRLRKLEIIIGSEKLILKRLSGHKMFGVIESVALLKDLLQKNVSPMNANASKIIELLSKVQEISKKLNYNGLEMKQKFDKLHSITLKAKGELNLLFNVIKRMKSLEMFCREAKKLPVTINNLRVQYSETSKTLKSNNQLLNDFETYMVKDVVNTVSSLQSLNTQVQVCAEKCQSYY